MSLIPAINHATVGDYKVFYRSAGPPSAPVLLLLMGFPSSSNQFRHLIPLLATEYHVIAPDFPGFGFTETPEKYPHTFANMAEVMEGFVDALKIDKFAMYIFDYGAPVGLRMAMKRPDAVTALITQNGNAYTEGLGAFWDPLKKFWASGSEADREGIRSFMSLNVTESQYTTGTKDVSKLDPATWWLDWTLMNNRPGNVDYQLDLFYDYRTNVELYPKWQEWFRKSQVPTLVVWGKNDPL
ncbi:MAG: hypothetical protein Q9227_009208 [Pyrenula ochraceoflavens]